LIEQKRLVDEELFLPTDDAKAKYETSRQQQGYSEHNVVIFIRSFACPIVNNSLTKEKLIQCIRLQDRKFREFFCIGRGLEYKFSVLSFRTVIVGFRYWSKRAGMKRSTWSKEPRYFVGMAGPLVWKIDAQEDSKYVVVFKDSDRRRFSEQQLTTFLVGELEDGEATLWNRTLNLDRE
jgi:hypothetical protein